MLQKPLTHVTRRDANDRVFTRIVAWGSAKKLYADDPFFQGFEVPRNRLINDVFEKLPTPLTGLKSSTFNHFSQMLLKMFNILFGF